MSTRGRTPDDPRPRGEYPPGYAGLEQRVAEEERRIVTNRQLAVAALALAVLLVVAVVALVVALVALNRDLDAVSTATPAEGSVGTDALQDEAVTAEKIAPGAVTVDALADGAVSNGKVAPDSLTGASIDESTLGRVPVAARARDAAALDGLPASAFLSGVALVEVESDSDTDEAKGPVTASCPADTIVIAGGVSVQGATSGVAVVASAPEGRTGWTGRAQAFEPPGSAWQLVVTAVCATGGA